MCANSFRFAPSIRDEVKHIIRRKWRFVAVAKHIIIMIIMIVNLIIIIIIIPSRIEPVLRRTASVSNWIVNTRQIINICS